MRWIIPFTLGLTLLLGATGTATAADTRLTLMSPANGAHIAGSTVQVMFSVNGVTLVPSTVPLEQAGKRPEANVPGQGHIHLMLDLQPLVVWGQNTPYTFTDVPPGDHQLTVELVTNDHSMFSPQVVQQVRFTTTAPDLQAPTGTQASAGTLPATGAGAGSTLPTLALALLGGLLLMSGGWLRRRQAR